MSLTTLDRWRHKIPFWWWLTYDAIVGAVIGLSISPSDAAFWIGMAVLGVAVVIDVIEFTVKRPSARAKLERATTSGSALALEQATTPDPTPRLSELETDDGFGI